MEQSRVTRCRASTRIATGTCLSHTQRPKGVPVGARVYTTQDPACRAAGRPVWPPRSSVPDLRGDVLELVDFAVAALRDETGVGIRVRSHHPRRIDVRLG